MTSIEHVLAIGAILLLAAVLISRVSRRTGIPSVLLFLGIGMLAGSDGPGGIWFDNAALAQSAGSVALALILFAGGLETRWSAVRNVLWQAVSLATVGVALTAALTGLFVHWLLGIPLVEGLLVGAIVSSTDAAAVFSILRAQRMNFRGLLQPLLEFESGSNDPMAVFLTIALTRLLVEPEATVLRLIPIFIWQMLLGACLGYVFGRISRALLNRIRLDTEGLYPVLMLSLSLLTFGVTASAGGSGFLAIYVCGIVLANGDFVHKRSLTRFIDGLSWLMQVSMFLILGLLVFPSRLPAIALSGTALALFLVLVARPISVFGALAASTLGFRDKLLVSWVGLRGAVPIVLATFPLLAGVPRADLYFDLVFFVVLTSILIQGTTIARVSRLLRLDAAPDQRSGPALEFASSNHGTSDLKEFVIFDTAAAVNRRLLDLKLPDSALAVLVSRGDQHLIPRGDTTLKAGDVVLMLTEPQDVPMLRDVLERPAVHSEA